MKRNEILENLVYAGIWLMLLLTPIISLLIRASSDQTIQFDWQEVFESWRQLLPFLLIFLLHNFVMARLLIYNHKLLLYACLTLAMLTVFQLYQCQQRPDNMGPMHEMRGDGHGPGDREGHFGPKDGPVPQDGDIKPGDDKPQDGDFDPHMPPGPRDLPPEHKNLPPPVKDGIPPIGGNPTIMLVGVVLLLGMNLGIKYFFKTRRDTKKIEELQRAHLEQQLEYLKYQINPHFFMNTLNNIHALVDIDPEQAKHTIVELSKLMRYVLYEGSKDKVSLKHEVAFLNNYITLMRLRYTERVRITVDIPEDLPDKMVPPMILVTFVENAFKHGVSYRKDSFIEIHVHTGDDRLYFNCRNSLADKGEQSQGGVGLSNVKRRLDLLFGNDHRLEMIQGIDDYEVILEMPIGQDITEPT